MHDDAVLQVHIVAEHDRRHVTLYSRALGGNWARDEVVTSGTLSLPCPTMELSLDDIYEEVEMPPASKHVRCPRSEPRTSQREAVPLNRMPCMDDVRPCRDYSLWPASHQDASTSFDTLAASSP